MKVKKTLQKAVFSKLLNLAVTINKPIIIHSRFSYQRTYEMAVDAGVEKAVFHWYSGPVDILDNIVASGFFCICHTCPGLQPPSSGGNGKSAFR